MINNSSMFSNLRAITLKMQGHESHLGGVKPGLWSMDWIMDLSLSSAFCRVGEKLIMHIQPINLLNLLPRPVKASSLSPQRIKVM